MSPRSGVCTGAPQSQLVYRSLLVAMDESLQTSDVGPDGLREAKQGVRLRVPSSRGQMRVKGFEGLDSIEQRRSEDSQRGEHRHPANVDQVMNLHGYLVVVF
jgi:hypothetical protein